MKEVSANVVNYSEAMRNLRDENEQFVKMIDKLGIEVEQLKAERDEARAELGYK